MSTEQTHTPERLNIFCGNATGKGLIRLEIEGTGEHVASMPRGERSLAHADRIAARYNALAGLNPEAVGEALWALKQMVGSLPRDSRQLQWLDPDVEKIARAALAKLGAKGGEA